MDFTNLLYAFTCLSFAVVVGAAIYEHIAVVPRWTAAPPSSLSMFQGMYGLNPAPFWKFIHPVTLLLMVVSMIVFWDTETRLNLALAFTGYVVVLTITFVYFVPELIAITGAEYTEKSDNLLTRRARLWERLSLFRLAFLIVLSIILMLHG